MKTLLTYFLKNQTKHARSQKGFTLIELLVAMIIAFLVITPLLAFMTDILNTDRKEQAKASSEHEIQAALDYMAQDMEQAVYIYDADGIYGNSASGITGIINQLPNPSDTTKTPILVFWKRHFLSQSQIVQVGTNNVLAGSLVNLPNGSPNQQDYQLYSLVAYYLVKDGNPTWNSTTTRIARWEIIDGIRALNGTQSRTETVGSVSQNTQYLVLPSPNFMPFNLTLPGLLKQKLGNWTNWANNSGSYSLTANPLTTLVDFIDQTQMTPQTSCNANEQQVPSSNTSLVGTTFQTGSFYACVNSQNYVARVFIRGNAEARFQAGATYNPNVSQYYPTASIQIKGRGFLGIQ